MPVGRSDKMLTVRPRPEGPASAELRSRIEELEAINHRLRQSLEAAERRADRATVVGVEALATACHDLRQPLQTLLLLQGLLARSVEGKKSQELVARLDATLITLTSRIAGVALDPIAMPLETPVAMPRSILPLAACPNDSPVILVVDDDRECRVTLREVLEADGHDVEDYASCEEFLAAYRPGREACLLVDAYLPGMSGLELLERLHQQGDRIPAIMITGNSDVAMAVQAMKLGACDFIEKPISGSGLSAVVVRALALSRDGNLHFALQEEAARHMASLTPRQRQIMDLVLAGHPSKNIASDLGISQRTVENHRAAIMKRTGAKSLPALARLAAVAEIAGDAERSQTAPPDCAGTVS